MALNGCPSFIFFVREQENSTFYGLKNNIIRNFFTVVVFFRYFCACNQIKLLCW